MVEMEMRNRRTTPATASRTRRFRLRMGNRWTMGRSLLPCRHHRAGATAVGRGGQMPAGEGHIDADHTGRSVGTAGVARAVRLVRGHQPALSGGVGFPPGVEEAMVERGVDEAFAEELGADSLPQ